MGKKVSVIVFIGVALLIVFAGFAGQALVSAEEAPATVPFKATYQTFPVIVGGGPADGSVELDIPAVGYGTHLGKSEWYADSEVIFDPFPFPQTGVMSFTAANGAELIGTFAGLSAPNDRGGFDYWGKYEITGGTGRFSGTTGRGSYYGGADGVSGTLTFDGTLTNP